MSTTPPKPTYPPPPPAPPVPPLEKIKHVHLSAVAGTGMGALAGMLRSKGLKVTGSDLNVYPPMSTQLAEAGIELKLGYKAENLEPKPDLVIVGNALSRGNPEIEALLASGIPYVSFPAALAKFFLAGRQSIVIAGTHGKTTTSSLAAWVLESAGKDPSFLIGGVPKNFGKGNRDAGGKHFVVEGDEYDTAFFDKESKFLHYQPRIALVTSVEFDHADIFRDLDHVKSAFRKFIGLVPKDGLLVVNHDDPGAMDCVRGASCVVETYGLESGADWTASDVRWKDGRASFTAMRRGEKFGEMELPMIGRHNLQNALGVIAALAGAGLNAREIAKGLASFQGVKRRQELRGEEGGVAVIDDFAHHPTAVKVTLEALKAGYPGRRLWAIFEPRSASSRRKVFQKAYGEAFDAADKIVIADAYLAEKLAPELRFDPAALVADLKARGKDAVSKPSADAIVEALLPEAKKGDVLAVLSNGGFDGIHAKLLSGLATRR
jgi:UDP-N-acetylmuramate: L-alanyl-gamma-D-glutamyl-meso-diaminopimelate ligase